MTNDPVNYVRQGALIASALILIQQTEATCPKVKDFRQLYHKVLCYCWLQGHVSMGWCHLTGPCSLLYATCEHFPVWENGRADVAILSTLWEIVCKCLHSPCACSESIFRVHVSIEVAESWMVVKCAVVVDDCGQQMIYIALSSLIPVCSGHLNNEHKSACSLTGTLTDTCPR